MSEKFACVVYKGKNGWHRTGEPRIETIFFKLKFSAIGFKFCLFFSFFNDHFLLFILASVKWPRNPMLNVVETLQQRCDNVLITSESDVVAKSENDIGTTLIFDRVLTLWQRQQWRCDNVVTTSLCQLGILILCKY